MLRFLAIHIALAPLIALSGGLTVGRQSARMTDGATLVETVDGVVQLALFEGRSPDRDVISGVEKFIPGDQSLRPERL